MSKKRRAETEAALAASGTAETIAEDLQPTPPARQPSKRQMKAVLRAAADGGKTEADTPAIADAGQEPPPAATGPAEIVSRDVPLDLIDPSPLNPRRTPHTTEEIDGIGDSIVEKGLLHPIMLRPSHDPLKPGRFDIIIGEGRWRASMMKRAEGKLPHDYKIAARIRDCSDSELVILAAIENFKRVDLTEIDQAELFQRVRPHVVRRDGETTEAAIGRMFNVSEATVWRRLRCLHRPGASGRGQDRQPAEVAGPAGDAGNLAGSDLALVEGRLDQQLADELRAILFRPAKRAREGDKARVHALLLWRGLAEDDIGDFIRITPAGRGVVRAALADEWSAA